MRPLIFFALLSIVCSCSLHPQMPEGKNITINLKLDSTISNHEQWVYLHRYDDNEFLIEDSAFIKKGQKDIHRKSTLIVFYSLKKVLSNCI